MDAHDRVIWAQTNKGTRIGTAFDHVGVLRGVGDSGRLVRWYAQQARAIGFDFDARPIGEVMAEVNHGRWIARCSVCGGAEEAAWQEPIFYCLSCGNAENGGHTMGIIFPENRVEIEGVLLARPMENRNWVPGEMAAELAVENMEHGFDSCLSRKGARAQGFL